MWVILFSPKDTSFCWRWRGSSNSVYSSLTLSYVTAALGCSQLHDGCDRVNIRSWMINLNYSTRAQWRAEHTTEWPHFWRMATLRRSNTLFSSFETDGTWICRPLESWWLNSYTFVYTTKSVFERRRDAANERISQDLLFRWVFL